MSTGGECYDERAGRIMNLVHVAYEGVLCTSFILQIG